MFSSVPHLCNPFRMLKSYWETFHRPTEMPLSNIKKILKVGKFPEKACNFLSKNIQHGLKMDNVAEITTKNFLKMASLKPKPNNIAFWRSILLYIYWLTAKSNIKPSQFILLKVILVQALLQVTHFYSPVESSTNPRQPSLKMHHKRHLLNLIHTLTTKSQLRYNHQNYVHSITLLSPNHNR